MNTDFSITARVGKALRGSAEFELFELGGPLFGREPRTREAGPTFLMQWRANRQQNHDGKEEEMGIGQAFLPEFDQEMAGVRRTLERVPEEKFDWRPHPKSGTMGWLASHLATLPTLAVRTIEKESHEIAPGGQPPAGPPKLKTRQEVLETFDKNRDAARAAIAGASDEHLTKTWTLLFHGKTVFSMPRAAALRGMLMNHMIHHRAQLGVYLRLCDVPVPSLYGPSADEQF